jgi:hypothetical protein
MIRISTRIWAGVLAVALLPAFAIASDNNAGSNATGATNKTNAPETGTSTAASAGSAAPATGINPPGDPLLRLMVSQGVLGADDVAKLAGVPSSELRDRLLLLLLTKNKSTLSAEDVNALKAPGSADGGAPASFTEKSEEQPSGPPQVQAQPPPAGPIPAVAPIRVLQIDPPKREGVVPVVTIGKNVRIQPYGLFKFSTIYDTSSPYGNDFPLPAFNPNNNGPSTIPEFRVKSRFIRFGANFEWLDTPHLVITGKVEADFEGNFSRTNNRNISTIRSNAFQLRQAYVRIDYKPNDKNSVFALFGEDWTPFASSTLPNLFETTGLGIGFGSLYERLPQTRVGLEHNFGSFKLGPEFAVVLPAYGNLPADLTAIVATPTAGVTATVPTANNEGVGNQLGFGERQGADSGLPELEARIVGQFQLDHAPGVAPAQVIVSGVHATRNAIVLANQVPAAFTAAFPRGAQTSSDRNAWTGEIQLPTRWFTIVAKYYNGSDLRYFFAGQIYGPFNATTGLTGTANAQTVDGSSTLVFGLRNGVPVLANSLPPRAQGGFINIGFPLSRWFNANPAGHNAGWQLFLHGGYDQVLARDVRRENGNREKGRLYAGTLFYKLNSFVSFALEESLYTTVAIPNTAGLPVFNGRPQREWNDFRSEFGPLFTF